MPVPRNDSCVRGTRQCLEHETQYRLAATLPRLPHHERKTDFRARRRIPHGGDCDGDQRPDMLDRTESQRVIGAE